MCFRVAVALPMLAGAETVTVRGESQFVVVNLSEVGFTVRPRLPVRVTLTVTLPAGFVARTTV